MVQLLMQWQTEPFGGGRSERNDSQVPHDAPKVRTPRIDFGMRRGAAVSVCITHQRTRALPLPSSSSLSAGCVQEDRGEYTTVLYVSSRVFRKF